MAPGVCIACLIDAVSSFENGALVERESGSVTASLAVHNPRTRAAAQSPPLLSYLSFPLAHHDWGAAPTSPLRKVTSWSTKGRHRSGLPKVCDQTGESKDPNAHKNVGV